jgi:hypothetical protein
MAQCGAKGVRAVIINSAGFGELGAEGDAAAAGLPGRGAAARHPRARAQLPGHHQHRSIAARLLQLHQHAAAPRHGLAGGAKRWRRRLHPAGLADIGVGLRMYASNGNACDVSITEILRYWGEDPGTEVDRALHRGLCRPGGFPRGGCSEVAARKPVLAMRAGRTERGAQAASSHTGALAGVDGCHRPDLRAAPASCLRRRGRADPRRHGPCHPAGAARPAHGRAHQHRRAGGHRHRCAGVARAGGAGRWARTVAAAARGAAAAGGAGEPGGRDRHGGARALPRRAAVHCSTTTAIDAICWWPSSRPRSPTRRPSRARSSRPAAARKPIVCNFMTDLTQERFRPHPAHPAGRRRAVLRLPRRCGARAGRAGSLAPRLRERPAATSRAGFDDVDTAAARASSTAAQRDGRRSSRPTRWRACSACYGASRWRLAQVAADGRGGRPRRRADRLPGGGQDRHRGASHKSDVGGVAAQPGDEPTRCVPP